MICRRECNLSVSDSLIQSVITAVLQSGRDLARQRLSLRKESPPLIFAWHEKEYLGAAHGIAGILAMLLKYVRPLIIRLIGN